MKFEDVLYGANNEIEESHKIIEHIKNYCKDCYKYESNSYILIKLLSNKIKILKSLKYDNYDEVSLNLKNIDEQIYRQIKIFKDKVNKDFNDKDKTSIKDELKNQNSTINLKYNLEHTNKDKNNKSDKPKEFTLKNFKDNLYNGMENFIFAQNSKEFNDFILCQECTKFFLLIFLIHAFQFGQQMYLVSYLTFQSNLTLKF